MVRLIRDAQTKQYRNIKRTLDGIVFLLRVTLGAVFLSSGISKIISAESLVGMIKSLSIDLSSVAGEIAIVLCAVEIIVGIFLIAGLLVKQSSLVVMFLLVLFIAVFLPQLMVQNEVDCNCFGPFLSSRVDTIFLIRDLLLLGTAFIVHDKEKQILWAITCN